MLNFVHWFHKKDILPMTYYKVLSFLVLTCYIFIYVFFILLTLYDIIAGKHLDKDRNEKYFSNTTPSPKVFLYGGLYKHT